MSTTDIPQTSSTHWETSTTIDSSTTRIIEPTTTVATNLLTNQTQKSIKALIYNGTGYYIEDEVDPGLNDLQTLFLACFATLIPLVISLLTAFGIRMLWTKYKRQKEEPRYDGILDRPETQESRPLHSHLLNSDKKCVETHLAITTEEVEVLDQSGLNQIRSNNHSSTNGSIITMTLKNNHLIVETEERNDIEEDSRETTMKYSPGARNGVFVVEVQQGVRRSPSSGGGGGGGGGGVVPSPSSTADPQELSVPVSDHQCALVHNPPDKYNDDETLEECDEDYVETTSPSPPCTVVKSDALATQIRTGLAQSDTSLTSFSYGYGNQQGYDNGAYGYAIYGGYVNDEPLGRRLPVDIDKPKITAAIYKTLRKIESQVIDDDDHQEEQRRLGNCMDVEN